MVLAGSLLLLELAEKDVYSVFMACLRILVFLVTIEPSVLEGSRKSLVSLAFPHFSDVTALLIATGLCWRTKPSWFKQADRTSPESYVHTTPSSLCTYMIVSCNMIFKVRLWILIFLVSIETSMLEKGQGTTLQIVYWGVCHSMASPCAMDEKATTG